MLPKKSDLPLLSSINTKRATKITERRTPELVFGLIGPVASGVSTTAQILENDLRTRYNYDVKPIIKMSEFIKENAHLVGETPGKHLSGSDRIIHLQNVGNALRENFGADFLAKKAIETIALARHQDGYDEVETEGGEKQQVPKVRRCAYIIDSLKNPEELHLLSEVYGDMFWVIGVFAPEHIRVERLKSEGVATQEITRIIERDQEAAYRVVPANQSVDSGAAG